MAKKRTAGVGKIESPVPVVAHEAGGNKTAGNEPGRSDASGNEADSNEAGGSEAVDDPRQPRLWRDDGWTARVIKNIDDDGWAVEMIKDGEREPALTGPWTMGRDKKNPKPFDAFAFSTLVKTASEVVRRHEQHQHAMLHKSVTVDVGAQRITVSLDIEPDEDDPSAQLSACDESGDELARVRVEPNFKLTRASATAWAERGYKVPR